MKSRLLRLLPFLAVAFPAQAAPNFWQPNPSLTPTPVPPALHEVVEPVQYKLATPTPQAVPEIQFATPTPTPLPGLKPKNPTKSAILSAVIPGLGQVDAGDPLKGLGFAAVFGVGLWQTLYNFQLVPQPNNIGLLGSRNDDLGHVFGLITLAAYGFGVQDAYATAVSYDRRNHLALSFGIGPRPTLDLAYLF